MRKIARLILASTLACGIACGAASAQTLSYTSTTFSIPATTDVILVLPSSNTKYLGIFVQTTNSTCYLAFGVAASASSGLILGSGSFVGNGYVWEADSGPPRNAIHIYCNQITSVVVLLGG